MLAVICADTFVRTLTISYAGLGVRREKRIVIRFSSCEDNRRIRGKAHELRLLVMLTVPINRATDHVILIRVGVVLVEVLHIIITQADLKGMKAVVQRIIISVITAVVIILLHFIQMSSHISIRRFSRWSSSSSSGWRR